MANFDQCYMVIPYHFMVYWKSNLHILLDWLSARGIEMFRR